MKDNKKIKQDKVYRLRRWFNEIISWGEKYRPEVLNMDFRSAYKWFKLHGFRCPYEIFCRLWMEYKDKKQSEKLVDWEDI
jgi:hypothetical protein